jgi:hypothetical protein
VRSSISSANIPIPIIMASSIQSSNTGRRSTAKWRSSTYSLAC